MTDEEARAMIMRLRDAKLKEHDALRNRLIGMETAIAEFARAAGIEVIEVQPLSGREG